MGRAYVYVLMWGLLLLSGCQRQPAVDYAPLETSGRDITIHLSITDAGGADVIDSDLIKELTLINEEIAPKAPQREIPYRPVSSLGGRMELAFVAPLPNANKLAKTLVDGQKLEARMTIRYRSQLLPCVCHFVYHTKGIAGLLGGEGVRLVSVRVGEQVFPRLPLEPHVTIYLQMDPSRDRLLPKRQPESV